LNKIVENLLGVIGFISASYGIYLLSEPAAFILGGGFLVLNSILGKK